VGRETRGKLIGRGDAGRGCATARLCANYGKSGAIATKSQRRKKREIGEKAKKKTTLKCRGLRNMGAWSDMRLAEPKFEVNTIQKVLKKWVHQICGGRVAERDNGRPAPARKEKKTGSPEKWTGKKDERGGYRAAGKNTVGSYFGAEIGGQTRGVDHSVHFTRHRLVKPKQASNEGLVGGEGASRKETGSDLYGISLFPITLKKRN